MKCLHLLLTIAIFAPLFIAAGCCKSKNCCPKKQTTSVTTNCCNDKNCCSKKENTPMKKNPVEKLADNKKTYNETDDQKKIIQEA